MNKLIAIIFLIGGLACSEVESLTPILSSTQSNQRIALFDAALRYQTTDGTVEQLDGATLVAGTTYRIFTDSEAIRWEGEVPVKCLFWLDTTYINKEKKTPYDYNGASGEDVFGAGAYQIKVRSYYGTPEEVIYRQEDIVSFTVEAAPSTEEILYGAPITISEGGEYTGNWESQDAEVPAVRITTSEPVIIQDANLRGRGDLIRLSGGKESNLTVLNTRGEGLNPNVAGKHPGRFLEVTLGYAYVRVEHCYLEGTSGMWLYDSKEGATAQIRYNEAKNIDGRISDGNGGWQPGQRQFVQFVQFDKGNELVNTEVAWNQIINEPYESRPEDVINLYKTSGASAQDPVAIHNNYIQGAYPADFGGSEAGEFSGGGIMLGDAGGDYLYAFDNQVVSTANYGIAIAGGQHNRIYNNRVISTGRLADGTYTAASYAAGFYMANYSNPAPFGDNTGSGNVSGWVNENENYAWANYRNDWWIESDATAWENNEHWQGELTLSTERDEFERFQRKLVDQGITVGPPPVE